MDETEHTPNGSQQPRPSSKVYSVPRRYDLATLFAVSLAYACLFGFMRLCGWPAGVFVSVAGFFTCVGLGQALLFKGKAPRAASVVVGALSGLVVAVIQAIRWGWYEPVGAICMSIAGSLFGYAGGVVVAGVFLVADLTRKLAKRLANR